MVRVVAAPQRPLEPASPPQPSQTEAWPESGPLNGPSSQPDHPQVVRPDAAHETRELAKPAEKEATPAEGLAHDFTGPGRYAPNEPLDEAPSFRTASSAVIQHPDDSLPDGQGQATAALLINAQGNVDAVLVSAEQLPRRFVRAIQKAFEAQSFQPGRMGGQEQAARLCLTVQFQEGEPPRWEFRPSPAGWADRVVTAENALASCTPSASAR